MTLSARPLENDERDYLLKKRDELDEYKLHLPELLLTFGWAGLCLAGIPSVIWIVIWRLTGRLDGLPWHEDQLVEGGVYTICALAISYTAYLLALDIWQTKRSFQKTMANLSKEFAENEVDEMHFRIEEIMSLEEPEHHMRIYLMKLKDGRVRVRYDYESADTDGKGESRRTDFAISHEMRMVHFRHLNEYLYTCLSEKRRKPRALPLDLNPKDWPEDETWLEAPWDEIKSQYGA
ncbi:hypothetical protein [Qipengyuania sp. DGS5-3]|uniref:hypothetical protein n=1 Tax=Qipengyuania sp. DGS5-3 TaxID=3349632 RepID=UPI0036D292E5